MSAPQTSSSARPPPAAPASSLPKQVLVLIRGWAGAIGGAVIGYVLFRLLIGQGFYGIMVIGAAIGMLAGLAAGAKNIGLGVICAVLSLAVSVVAEWHHFPFVKDKSLGYFLTHFHQVIPVHLIFIGLGGLAAYWFGQGR